MITYGLFYCYKGKIPIWEKVEKMIERVEYGVIECFDRFKDFEDFEPNLERVASIKTDKFADAKKYYEKIKIRSVTKVFENNVKTLEVHQTILFKEEYDENDEVLDFEILEIYGFQDKFEYNDILNGIF